MNARHVHRAALAALLWTASPAAIHALDPSVFVVTRAAGGGSCDTMTLASPWTVLPGVEAVGEGAMTVRTFYGRVYVVDRSLATVQVIDPDSLDTVLTFPVGAGTEPHDILLSAPDVAYVSRHASTYLLKVDPTTGVELGSVDLTAVADADGVPDMSMMARDGRHLFVQLRRVDRFTLQPARPSMLGVVDLDTDTLVDADPAMPGVQGIALVGTLPAFKMHVEPLARRLFVSAPGPRLDISGGIEEIDLDALRSLGFILSERNAIGDVGGFTMISPDAGYAIGHTDIVASSHLFPFSRVPASPMELFFTFGTVDVLIHDPASGLMFMPVPEHHLDPTFGVAVFDGATGTLVSGAPVATGAPPVDLAVVRETTPGEARELTVAGPDPATGALSLSFRPACGASDHNVIFGGLGGVGSYGYSGQVCGIGTTGELDSFDPGAGSFFFLVVATGAGGIEGSYGGDGAGDERPEDLLDPVCGFTRDLSFSCDR